MDYLYLNAIVKEVYKDLPCGCPFPTEFGRNMYATVSGLDCLSNPDVPNVLSFFTLRAKGQASAMVFSNIQKHTNSASVGRFIQSIGWTWNGDKLFRELDDILDVGFFSEEEINETALRGGSFALPKDRRNSYETISVELSPKVKQAILTTVLLRWLRFEAPLRIAVPKNVDYNSYVISAMKQIYRIFPVSLRAKAGFCSYLPSDKNVPETIFIGFIPEEMADSRTLCLDGSSAAACATLNCGTNSATLDTFIHHIAHESEDELPTFFEEMYEDLEGSGSNEKMVLVNYRDYQFIGMALNLLSLDGSLSELISQWNSKFFNHKDRDNIPLRWREKIRKKIRSTIDPAEFCSLAERRLNAEAFDGLIAYREYCAGNAELADALWNTAVAQQIGRKKTYTDIYSHVSKRQKDLSFILDEPKLDVLFRKSVEEQLAALREKPAQDLKSIEKLMGEVRELLDYTDKREIADGAQLKQSVEALFTELTNAKNRLQLEKMTEGFRQRCAQPYQNDLEKTQLLLDEMGSYRSRIAAKAEVPGTDLLLADIDTFIVTLNDHKNDLIHAGFVQRCEKIAAKPANTVDQIEKITDEAKALLTEIAAAAPTEKNATLQADLQEFIAKKNAEINSSNVKFQEIEKIFNNGLAYFAVLEALDRADKSQLEDHHRQKICDRLKVRRPDTLENYEKSFSAYYGKALTLANVAVLPDYVTGIIARDICQLDTISLTCSQKTSAAANAERIIRALAIAGKLSEAHKLSVNYDGTEVSDPVWFKNLLLLTHSTATMGDRSHLERVVRNLVEKNAFSGNEMVPAVMMLIRCDSDPSMLLPYVLRGDFRGADEEQYRQVFELLLHNSNANPREALADMEEIVEKRKEYADSTALKAFYRFSRGHKPKESGGNNKLMITIIACMGVVIVALIVAVVLMALKTRQPEVPPTVPPTVPTTVATVPTETEEPVSCPEEFVFLHQNQQGISQLYGNNQITDFASHSTRVAQILDAADEETQRLILSSYSNFHGTDVIIDDQGNAVSWDEYFFWMCWYYADQDVSVFRGVLQTAEPVEPVLSMLRVIHHDRFRQAAVTEEVPEEIVPAETAAQTIAPSMETPAPVVSTDSAADMTTAAETTGKTSEVPAETEPITEVTEEIAAPTGASEPAIPETTPTETVPPTTVSDVKAVITEAAATSYEASQTYATRLLLIRKLFGENFQYDFTFHANSVSALNITADELNPTYQCFIEHYSMFPGDYIIPICDGTEVTWNEYVFWECWLLAQRGTIDISLATFDNELSEDVEEVLSVIHLLADGAECPEADEGEIADSADENLSVMQTIIRDAQNAFEKAQKNYNYFFELVTLQ